ncbi:collagen alpha-2(I) chain-like [Maniola jurtina]|uniref:collagen alpha-2(I) chain-like n=1 Tax=Maniola jurtina TaxID=191418 RepID=UPI001E68CE77|nr:collagen alpha-2(I) chain-like [Maniola jurtina]
MLNFTDGPEGQGQNNVQNYRPPIGDGQLSEIAGGAQNAFPLGQGALNPRNPSNSINAPLGQELSLPGGGGAQSGQLLGQIVTLPGNEQSNIPLELPSLPGNVQSIPPNLLGTLQNLQQADPNNLQNSLPLGEVSSIAGNVPSIAGIPGGSLASKPTSAIQNSLPAAGQLSNIPGVGGQNNLPGVGQLSNFPGSGVQNNLPGIGQLSNIPGSSVQNSNSGSQDGNIGSQSGNAGSQTGNNGNTGQSNDLRELIRLLTTIIQNRNSDNSGSQNGNSGSQNGNSGSQNGNSGSQNGNSGSQGPSNDNALPLGNDNGVTGGENILARGAVGNGGSQRNNGTAGLQGGYNGNNGQMNNNFWVPMVNWENMPNGVGPDLDKVNVERPCHASFEECVKQYFVQHAHCKLSYDRVPEPLVRPVSTTYLARVNLTLSASDVIYSGLNGNIEEFYVNKETDKLVITIRFRNVTYYSKDTFYTFHRRGREPVVNVDYLFANFRSLTTTTVIPYIDDLKLDRSTTHAFVDDANPRFNFGPWAFVNSDRSVRETLPTLMADMRTNVQEFFLTEAAFFAVTYIQRNLCDFGFKIL